MKVLKTLWTLLLILFALVCIFVLVCGFNPDLTNKVADFLYADRKDSISEEDNSTAGTDVVSTGIRSGAVGDEDPGIIEASGPSGYIPPNQADLYVPVNVAGRNGYEPVQEDVRQIEEEEARELEQQIGVGNTGDGLSFDPVLYPYYAMLDEKGKHLYRQIYANANDLNGQFAPVEEIQVEELKDIFSAVFNDHPELFFMETAYFCKYKRNGQCAEIDLSFNRTAQNLENSRAEFMGRAEEILAGARALSGDYSKEKYVHDTLADRISYRIDAELNQTAYSALINGQTVCAGYARAFQYLMQQLGIPCYYCTGYAGENHAWNIIALDDGYYNVDITWDDTDRGRNYDYFNKSDADYADTHMRKEMSVYLPPCNGQKYRNLEQNEEELSGQEQDEKQILSRREILGQQDQEELFRLLEQNGLSELDWILDGQNERKRSIEELGIRPEEVLTSLNDYYRDCYDQITTAGRGKYIFTNVIEGEDLFWQWSDSYKSEEVLDAYLVDAVIDIGAEFYSLIYLAEELEDDRYLIIHVIALE